MRIRFPNVAQPARSKDVHGVLLEPAPGLLGSDDDHLGPVGFAKTLGKGFSDPVSAQVLIFDVDEPTGCGDAYRSGLLYGLMNDMDWETTGRLAAIMGACKIEVNGTQNHAPTRDEVAIRFKQNFDYMPW